MVFVEIECGQDHSRYELTDPGKQCLEGVVRGKPIVFSLISRFYALIRPNYTIFRSKITSDGLSKGHKFYMKSKFEKNDGLRFRLNPLDDLTKHEMTIQAMVFSTLKF